MDRDLFVYLRELNLTDQEINYIEKNNDFIHNATKEHTKLIIDIIKEKGINDLELKDILLKNVYLVTETLNRINKLDNIYTNIIKFNKNEIKYILLNNYNAFSINPTELKNIIDYLISTGYSNNSIKKLLLTNPNIINYKLNDFIKKIV